MLYKRITAWEVRKMNGVKIRAETYSGSIMEWEILVENRKVFILHNNPFDDGLQPLDKKQYWFSWCICWTELEDSKPSRNINRIRTLDDEFAEWEEVYISDESIDDALKHTCKQVYIYTLKNWNHIVQHPYHYNSQLDVWFYTYKYIVKIPKEEPVEEMTIEQVNKALGKKIKIIE